MKRPVWLLDVDGVLNAPRPGWGAPPRSGTASSGGLLFRIRWAPPLVARIRGLHNSGLVEIRWCSTWCSDADQIERLLGLPRLVRAWHHEVTPHTAPTAQLTAALAVLDQGRRLVWTDDDAIPTSGPVRDELTANGRALLITPVPTRGLQPDDLDAIEAFLSSDDQHERDGPPDEALRIAHRQLGGPPQ